LSASLLPLFALKGPPRNPYRRRKLSTVNLLVQTSLDQLLLIVQTLFIFLQNKLP
jgi:hypothetical protein